MKKPTKKETRVMIMIIIRIRKRVNKKKTQRRKTNLTRTKKTKTLPIHSIRSKRNKFSRKTLMMKSIGIICL